jgi:plastocyanin
MQEAMMGLAEFRSGALRSVAAAGLVAGLFVASGGAAVAQTTGGQTWEVQVGGASNGPPVFEPMAYGPDPLVIRVGDKVTWSPVVGHTVTFPAGKPEPALFLPGPGQGELTAGPGLGPIGVTPSASGITATFDGTNQISTGDVEQALPGTAPLFTVTFSKPGTFGYICLFHPGMRGSVEVRAADAALPETPAQAKTRGQVTLGAIKAQAQALPGMIRPVHSGSVHTALAGAGNGYGASVLGFVNGDLTVKRGDTVVWTFADPFELHTVTFTSGGAPPAFVEPRPQTSGPPLLVIPASVASPSGDTYSGTGMANSGLMPYGNTFALRFDAPPGAYAYLCLLHPWMNGTVTVSG